MNNTIWEEGCAISLMANRHITEGQFTRTYLTVILFSALTLNSANHSDSCGLYPKFLHHNNHASLLCTPINKNLNIYTLTLFVTFIFNCIWQRYKNKSKTITKNTSSKSEHTSDQTIWPQCDADGTVWYWFFKDIQSNNVFWILQYLFHTLSFLPAHQIPPLAMFHLCKSKFIL